MGRALACQARRSSALDRYYREEETILTHVHLHSYTLYHTHTVYVLNIKLQITSETYLYSCKIRSEGDVGLLHVRGPRREESMTELLVKVASIGHEG